jgi:hypothetical protein
VYKDPSVLYNVKYRYKSFKEFTQYKAIPNDTNIGYYTEASFDNSGNLKVVGQQVLYPYTTHAINGFIQLNISPNAISKFRAKVDKGDIIGVTSYNSFDNLTVVDLIVGQAKNYIYINGAIVLPNDIIFNMSTDGAVEGNEFRIHLNCTSITLGTFALSIVQNYGTLGAATIKNIVAKDLYQMVNQDGGIVFDMVYKGDKWVMYQNYFNNKPYDLKDVAAEYNTAITAAITALSSQIGFVGKGSVHIGDVSNDLTQVITHNLGIIGNYVVVGSLSGTGTNDNADDDVTWVVSNLGANSFKLVVQETSTLVQDLTFSYIIFKL